MARRWFAIVSAGFLGGLLAVPVLAAPEPAKTKPDDKPAQAKTKPAADDIDDYELFKTFSDTVDQVQRNYVKEISRKELMEAAIEGVLSKLDPYSNYISPEELSSFKSNVESQFGGIGIQITMDRGKLTVSSPLVGTPAYRAGIQAGDWILEINGDSTKGLALDEAVRKLKGEVGTSVKLKFMHSDGSAAHEATIKRELIHVDTVLGDRRQTESDAWEYMHDQDKKIAYIRLTVFSNDTARDLRKTIKELTKNNMRGLILDLRFNPGGLLTSAVEISDMFVAEGKIVSTAGRNTEPRVYSARKSGTFEGFPMAVLVNRYSASASEIVAACLQDHNRALIVGERTWGKGSVQNVIDLQDGKAALKLTTAGYQRPNGKNIHRFPDAKETDEWGVRPNDGYEMKLPDEELRRLVDDRRDRDVVRPRPAAPAKTDPPAEKKTDAVPPEESKKPEPSPSPSTAPENAPSKSDAANVPFVDRQLHKAIEYLSAEIGKQTPPTVKKD